MSGFINIGNSGGGGAPSGSAGGDLSGTYPNPLVSIARGLKSSSTTINISGATAPTNGQVLTATSGTTATWQSITTSITLSGDVTGNSTTNTVIQINGSTVPAGGGLTTGNILQVSGSSALSYAALNLAGGSNFITGVLPSANQAAQSLGGDASSTTSAAQINIARGLKTATTTVAVSAATAPSAGQVLTASNGTTASWVKPVSGVAGAVQFSGSTVFNSNDSKLHWDNTNNRLGIGTNSPSATCNVSGTFQQDTGSFQFQPNASSIISMQGLADLSFTVNGGAFNITNNAGPITNSASTITNTASTITNTGTFMVAGSLFNCTSNSTNIVSNGGISLQDGDGTGIGGGISISSDAGLDIYTNNISPINIIADGGLSLTSTNGSVTLNSSGNIISITGTTQTTVGVAGGGSVLPARPVKYLNIIVAGVSYSIPLYNP